VITRKNSLKRQQFEGCQLASVSLYLRIRQEAILSRLIQWRNLFWEKLLGRFPEARLSRRHFITTQDNETCLETTFGRRTFVTNFLNFGLKVRSFEPLRPGDWPDFQFDLAALLRPAC
jgi:hypothetical protein